MPRLRINQVDDFRIGQKADLLLGQVTRVCQRCAGILGKKRRRMWVGAHGLILGCELLCNFAGARCDAMHLPSVGNWRLTHDMGWEPKNRITPDG